MSKLMAMIDDIKEKLTDQEYKLIVEEIALEEKGKKNYSKIKVAVGFLRRGNFEEDLSVELVHDFFAFVVPNEYVTSKHLTSGNLCSFQDLYLNSLNYIEDSYMDDFISFNIGDIHVHNYSAVILTIEQLNFDKVDDIF
jgi:hypothetical protein